MVGIHQVPIVNQYSDIARRMAELKLDRRPAPVGFSLPDGISIISSTDINPKPSGDMCFILRGQSLLLLRSRSGSATLSSSDRGRAFVRHMLKFFPTLKFSDTEIVLTEQEMDWLANSLELSRG